MNVRAMRLDTSAVIFQFQIIEGIWMKLGFRGGLPTPMVGTSYRCSITSKPTLHETEVMFHRFSQWLLIKKISYLTI